MLTEGAYIRSSLETNLFFCRIMKEHAIFIRAGLPPAGASAAEEALYFKDEFENLLAYTVDISGGNFGGGLFPSQQIVTDYTLEAEKKTSAATGIPINEGITYKELSLQSGKSTHGPCLYADVQSLNGRALALLKSFIQFKEHHHKEISSCHGFSWIYPDMIEHMMEEARLFHFLLSAITEKSHLGERAMYETIGHWNEFMREHAEYTRGMLDPSEEKLMNEANSYAHKYGTLMQIQDDLTPEDLKFLTQKSLDETAKFKAYEEAAVKGILSCEIKSVIVPLLADHLLREANHFSTLLKELDEALCG